MSTTTRGAGRQVALDEIRVPENVRALEESHVQALAGSIMLQGIIVPVVVRDDGDGFEPVAGFIASPRPGRSGRPRSRSSCVRWRPRTPIARSRTSRHAEIGMT